MPSYRVTTWAEVEPGMTVIDRTGQPRLIRAVEIVVPPDPNASFDTLLVTDHSGTYALSPTRTAMVMEVSRIEAAVNILTTFPGSEIIA